MATLKVVITREEGIWCVEAFDGSVVGCGRTLAEAFKEFGEDLEATAELVQGKDVENMMPGLVWLRINVLEVLRRGQQT